MLPRRLARWLGPARKDDPRSTCDRFLVRASRALRMVDATTAAARVAAIALALASVALALDMVHPSSGNVRAKAPFILLILSSAAMTVAALRAALRRPGRRWLARRTESVLRIDGELSAIATRTFDLSPAVDILAAEVAPVLASARPMRVLPLGPARRSVALALGAALALAGGLALANHFSPDRLGRAVAGLDEPAAPGPATLLAVRPERARVIEGRDLPVEVAVLGEPRSLSILAGPRGAARTSLRRVALERAASGRFVGKVPSVEEDLACEVELDGAIAAAIPVSVVRAPRVVSVRVHEVFPKYLGMPARDVDGGDVDVPDGTRLEILARTSSPPRDGLLRARWTEEGIEETQPLSLSPNATAPTALAGALDATRAGGYRVEYEDATGLPARDPRWFSISVRPDLPPRVEILQPAADRELSIDGSLTVEYEARDDHGLGELALVIAPRGAEPQKIALPCAPGQRWARGKLSIEPRRFGLFPGDTAAYYIAAADRHQPIPNRSASAPYVILVEENKLAREALTGIEWREEELLKSLESPRSKDESLEERIDRELAALRMLEALAEQQPSDDDMKELGDDPAKALSQEDLEDLDDALEDLDMGHDDGTEAQDGEKQKPCDDCKADAKARGKCPKCGRVGRCGTCGKPGHGRGCFAPEGARKMKMKRSRSGKPGAVAKIIPMPGRPDMKVPEDGEVARKYRELLEKRRELLRRIAQSLADGKPLPGALEKKLGREGAKALADAMTGHPPRPPMGVSSTKPSKPTNSKGRALRVRDEIPRDAVDLQPASVEEARRDAAPDRPLAADASEWDERLPDELRALVRAYFKAFGRTSK